MKNNNFKPNWPLIGNTVITDFLEKSIINKKISGTYIFSGPEYLGKFNAAVYFAKSLLCQNLRNNDKDFPCGACASCNILKNGNLDGHGDFFVISPDDEKKNISIEQVRDFIEKLNMTSFGGFYKVGIIDKAETLSDKAANALLKTLEEPKKNTILILVTHNISYLPETILSRSQVLNYKLVRSEDIYDYLFNVCHTSRDDARKFSRMCVGRPRLAVKLMENSEDLNDYEKKIGIFLDFFHTDINDRILALNEFIPAKLTGQGLVRMARDILMVWNTIVRDMLLFDCGCANIVQHETFLARIQAINIPGKKILELDKNINDGLLALGYNVNPKLVLENIAINII